MQNGVLSSSSPCSPISERPWKVRPVVSERTVRNWPRDFSTSELGVAFQSPVKNTGFLYLAKALRMIGTDASRSSLPDTDRCDVATTQSLNSQTSSTRGSAPGSGSCTTSIGFSRESIITPYCPPRKKMALAKVACIPVRRASSAGSSMPETRAVHQSISWRHAKSGASALMRAAVRTTSILPSIPSQWHTL